MTSNWLGKPTIDSSSRSRVSLSGNGPHLTANPTPPSRSGLRASLPSPSLAASPLSSAVTNPNGRRRYNVPSARQSDLTDYFSVQGSEPTKLSSNRRPRARTEEDTGKRKERGADWEKDGIEVIGHHILPSTTPISADLLAHGIINSSTTPMFPMDMPNQAHLTKSSAASEWIKDGRSRLRPLSSEDEIDVKLELSPQEIDQQSQQELPEVETADQRRKRSSLAAPTRKVLFLPNEAEDIGMQSVLRPRSIKAERSMSGEYSIIDSTTILNTALLDDSKNSREPTSKILPSTPSASGRTSSALPQVAYSPELHFNQQAKSGESFHHPNPKSINSPGLRSTSVPSSPLLSESLLPLLPASYPSPIQHSESLLRVFAPMGKESAARLRMLRRDQFAWESDHAFAKRKRELAEVEARKIQEEKVAREKVRGVWEPPSRPSKKQRISDALGKARQQPLTLSPGPDMEVQGRGAREILQNELEEEEEEAILQAITVSSATPSSFFKHNRHHHLSPLQVVGPLRVQGAPSPKRARPASSQQTYSHTQTSDNSSQTQSQLSLTGPAQIQLNSDSFRINRRRSESKSSQDHVRTNTPPSSRPETHIEPQPPNMAALSRSDLGSPPRSQLTPSLPVVLDIDKQNLQQLYASPKRIRYGQVLVERSPSLPRELNSSTWQQKPGPSISPGQLSGPFVKRRVHEGYTDIGSDDGIIESSIQPERSRLLPSKKLGENHLQGASNLYSEDNAGQFSVLSESSMLVEREGKLEEQQEDAGLIIVNEESSASNTFVHSSIPFESAGWMLKRQSSLEKFNGLEDDSQIVSDEEMDAVGIERNKLCRKTTQSSSGDQTPRRHPQPPNKPPLHHTLPSAPRQLTSDHKSVAHFPELGFHLLSEDDEIPIPSSQMNERLSPLRRLMIHPMSPKNKKISLQSPHFPSRSVRSESAVQSRSPPFSAQPANPILSNKKRTSGSWNFSSLLTHPLVSVQKATSRSSSPSAPLSSPSSSKTSPAKRNAKGLESQHKRRSLEKTTDLKQSSLLAHFERNVVPNPKRLARLHGLDEELDDIQPSDEDTVEATAAMERRDEGRNSNDLSGLGVALTEPSSSSEFVIPNSQPSPRQHGASFRRKAQRVMGRVPSPPPRDLLLSQLYSKPFTVRRSDPEADSHNEDEYDIVPDSQFEEDKTMTVGNPISRGRAFTEKDKVSAMKLEDRADMSPQKGRLLITNKSSIIATVAEQHESEYVEEEEEVDRDTTIVPDNPPTEDEADDDDDDPNATVVPIQNPDADIEEPAELLFEVSSLTSLSSDPTSVDTFMRRSDESISFWRFAAPSSDGPSA